jgi:hypothetical protein
VAEICAAASKSRNPGSIFKFQSQFLIYNSVSQDIAAKKRISVDAAAGNLPVITWKFFAYTNFILYGQII